MQVKVQTHKGRQVIQLIGNNVSYYSISLTDLSLFNEVQKTYNEVQSGNLILSAWSNPAVPYHKINNTQLFSLSYLFLLYYLKLRDTRDIWRTFPNIPVKTLSYMRERAFVFQYHLNYKIAILKCLHEGLTPHDVTRVQQIFKSCKLSPENHIYYDMLYESGEYVNLELTSPLLLDIKALEKELSEFAHQPQTIKLCRFWARSKLSFVAKGGNLDLEDLASELHINTIAAYRLCRPMQTIEYSENYARRALTNTTQRIITSHTKHKEKSNIWQNKQGGFTMRFDRLNEDSNVFDPTDVHIMDSLGFNEDIMHERLELRKIHEASIAAVS